MAECVNRPYWHFFEIAFTKASPDISPDVGFVGKAFRGEAVVLLPRAPK
jgi:hypothetical protein